MTPKDVEELFKLFLQITPNPADRYHQSYQDQMLNDNIYFLEFTSWIKQSHPDVWEGWQAIQDIKRGV